MNLVKKILMMIAKAVYAWFYVIPFNLKFASFIAYSFIIYFVYGTYNPAEIEIVVESHGLSMFTGFFLPFGIPYSHIKH